MGVCFQIVQAERQFYGGMTNFEWLRYTHRYSSSSIDVQAEQPDEQDKRRREALIKEIFADDTDYCGAYQEQGKPREPTADDEPTTPRRPSLRVVLNTPRVVERLPSNLPNYANRDSVKNGNLQIGNPFASPLSVKNEKNFQRSNPFASPLSAVGSRRTQLLKSPGLVQPPSSSHDKEAIVPPPPSSHDEEATPYWAQPESNNVASTRPVRNGSFLRVSTSFLHSSVAPSERRATSSTKSHVAPYQRPIKSLSRCPAKPKSHWKCLHCDTKFVSTSTVSIAKHKRSHAL
jgi:hypothetical protein